LKWLFEFNVLKTIPMNGPIALPELSAQCNVPLQQLMVVSSIVIACGLLRRGNESNTVSHSFFSYHITTNPNWNKSVNMVMDLYMPIAAKLPELTTKYGGTDKLTETAFGLAYKTDMPFFEYISADPVRIRDFSVAMQNIATSDIQKAEHLLKMYDWSSIGAATVVDVGGSSGHASILLLKHFPELRVVVQDLPDVVEKVKEEQRITNLPTEVRSRLEFMAQDYFEEQRVQADVYLIRQCLHNHADKTAAKLLAQIVPAMKKGARILIVERLLPGEGVELTVEEEIHVTALSMLMMEMFNARERGVADWREVLRVADSRLKIRSVNKPVGSIFGGVEVVLEE
ncbi:S-adenosyl-L-methionine-dependent methyltransferase, partial [Eremomyces bilateralis CBS 781.70]